MEIRFQSMSRPCELTNSQLDAVCYAINQYGDGDHPCASSKTISYFGIRYVIRCTTKLATDTDSWRQALALAALDVIRYAVYNNNVCVPDPRQINYPADSDIDTRYQ